MMREDVLRWVIVHTSVGHLSFVYADRPRRLSVLTVDGLLAKVYDLARLR